MDEEERVDFEDFRLIDERHRADFTENYQTQVCHHKHPITCIKQSFALMAGSNRQFGVKSVKTIII